MTIAIEEESLRWGVRIAAERIAALDVQPATRSGRK